MKNFKFKINGNEYDVAINEIEENIASIQVNGVDYSVELEKKADVPPPVKRPKAPVAKSEPAELKSTSGAIKTVLSPLPGVILDTKVKEGDKVTKGTVLLIMEAMKMENNIVCEHDGVVKTMKVKTGQSVLQNDVLVEIQ